MSNRTSLVALKRQSPQRLMAAPPGTGTGLRSCFLLACCLLAASSGLETPASGQDAGGQEASGQDASGQDASGQDASGQEASASESASADSLLHGFLFGQNKLGETVAPVANARIVFRREGRSFAAVTDEEGHYSVSGMAPGVHSYTIQYEGPSSYAEEKGERGIEMAAAGTYVADFYVAPAGVEPPGAAVAVVAVEGAPAAEAQPEVYFERADDGPPAAERRIAASVRPLSGAELAEHVDTAGDSRGWSWWLATPESEFPPGAYQATASLAGHSTDEVEKQVLSGSRTTFDLRLLSSVPGSGSSPGTPESPASRSPDSKATIISGQVIGQDSAGVSFEYIKNARLYVTAKDGASGRALANSDENGQYRIETLTPGNFEILIAAAGYRTSTGLEFNIPGPGRYVMDLYLAKRTRETAAAKPGSLSGTVQEELDRELRPLNSEEDGVVIEVNNVINGRQYFVQPDKSGAYHQFLEPGSWRATCRVPGFAESVSPVIEIRDREEQRDFLFKRSSASLSGEIHELLPDGERVPFLSTGECVVVRLSNRRREATDVPAYDARYEVALRAGAWRVNATPPVGYEFVDPDFSPLVLRDGERGERDFTLRRSAAGSLHCMILEQVGEQRRPMAADLLIGPVGAQPSQLPVGGETTMPLAPGKWFVSVVPPAGYDLIQRTAAPPIDVRANQTAECHFLLQRRECQAAPAIAIVGVEQIARAGKIASPPAVFFVSQEQDNSQQLKYTDAASVEPMTADQRRQYQLADSTAESGDWRWFLATSGAPLPIAQYHVEAQLEGYGAARSVAKVLCCDGENIFDAQLPMLRPDVTVEVCAYDSQTNSETMVSGMSVKFMNEELSENFVDAFSLTTDGGGMAEGVLQSGVGEYKVYLSGSVYEPQWRRISITQPVTRLKFKVFKPGDTALAPFAGIVLEEGAVPDKPIPGATVKLEPLEGQRIPGANPGREFSISLKANSAGEVSQADLPIGDYRVTVTASNYQGTEQLLRMSLNMPRQEFRLRPRNEEVDRALACMLLKGWGPSQEARGALRHYYRLANNAAPADHRVDYALALCLLSSRDRQLGESAKVALARAIDKQRVDFTWDRVWESSIWLDMEFMNAPLDKMLVAARTFRPPYPRSRASLDAANLMGVACAVLAGPRRESAPGDLDARTTEIQSAMDESHRAEFVQGFEYATSKWNAGHTEIAKQVDRCRAAWEAKRTERLEFYSYGAERLEEKSTELKGEMSSVTERLEARRVSLQEEYQKWRISVGEKAEQLQLQAAKCTTVQVRQRVSGYFGGGGFSGGFGGGMGGGGGGMGGGGGGVGGGPGGGGGGGMFLTTPLQSPQVFVQPWGSIFDLMRPLFRRAQTLKQTNQYSESFQYEGGYQGGYEGGERYQGGYEGGQQYQGGYQGGRRSGGSVSGFRITTSSNCAQFNMLLQSFERWVAAESRRFAREFQSIERSIHHGASRMKHQIDERQGMAFRARQRMRSLERTEMPECPGVAEFSEQLRQFSYYLQVSLEQRRQELLQVVGGGDVASHQCESSPAQP